MGIKTLFKFGLKAYQLASIPLSANVMLNLLSKHDPVDLKSFLADLSPAIDNEVIKIANSENLQANGGEIKVHAIDDKCFGVMWECYFTDAEGTHIKKSSKQTVPNRILTSASLDRIKNSSLTFPIDPPNINIEE